MADAGNPADEEEYFCRVQLALITCGGRVLLQLLQRRVGQITPKNHQDQPWSLDQFLKHNKKNILLSINNDSKRKSILYPTNQDTDLNKWDITLFAVVLQNACQLNDDDSRQLKQDICNLRELRNRIHHKGSPTLDKHIYQSYIGRISGAVQRTCDYMQEPGLKESLLKEIDKYEGLEHVYPNGHISELGCKSVDIINESDGAVENGLQQLDMTIQKKGLSVNIPVLEVMVMFRYYNREDEHAITEKLRVKFLEALEDGEDMSADRSSSELDVAVKSIVRTLFVEKKEISKVKSGCLVLSIQCHTMDAVISLVQDSLSGKLWSLFEPLEEVMRTDVDHALFEVCVGITKKSCWALLNKMVCQVSEKCGQRSYTVESTEQGVSIVVRIQRLLQSFTQRENLEKPFSLKEKVVLSPKHSEDREPKDSDDYSIHDENVQLLETVVRYSRLETRRKPETLLLFGLSGSGKTSLINTIYTEVTGFKGSNLQTGSGSTQSKTLDFKWYPNCGVREDNITNSYLKSRIGPIVGNLPNIIDCAGKSNVNDEQAKEILRHSLTGRIPPGTSIAALEELQNKKGVGCLNVNLPPCNPEWTVTKIIFVQSATEPIPKQLIDMLHDVLSEYDDRLPTKFKASLFMVITKYDLVHDEGRVLHRREKYARMTAQQFKDRKDELATALGIKNNVGDNCIPWASYCDTVMYPCVNVENSVWKLLEKIQFPKPVGHTGVPFSKTLRNHLNLKIRAFLTNASCFTYVLICFIIFLIAAFVCIIYISHQIQIKN